MNIPLDILFEKMDIFLLVFVRMSGLFVIAPIFGRRNIPSYFKIGFSFLLAMIVMNTISVSDLEEYNSIYKFFVLLLKEFMVGITLGYVSYLIFTAIYMAGEFIDMRIGFGMVNVLDPISNIQLPITANFYFILTMLIFFILNGHHSLIRGLYESYSWVPIGQAVFGNELLSDVIRLFGSIFLLGFKIAAPITAAILITDVALGVISKAVPQLNVFVIGMPLKIALGIIILILTIGIFNGVAGVMIDGMNTEIFKFLEDLSVK